MIVTRLLRGFVAIAAICAAVVIALTAASFAIYALVQPYVGSAGAAGVVTAVYALIALAIGLIAMPRRRRKPTEGASGVADDLMDLVRDKPIAAAGVAVAAGIMAMRNPRVIIEVVRALRGGGGRRKRD